MQRTPGKSWSTSTPNGSPRKPPYLVGKFAHLQFWRVGRRRPKFLEGGEGNGASSAKDGARHAAHQVQFGPLLIRCQLVSLHGGGEAALRAEREPLQGNDADSLGDAPLEVLFLLQPRSLGRDQP